MKKTKFNWNGYFQPTPKLFKQIGNSMLGGGMFAMGYAAITDHTTMMWVFLGIGVIGKIVSEFFTETE